AGDTGVVADCQPPRPATAGPHPARAAGPAGCPYRQAGTETRGVPAEQYPHGRGAAQPAREAGSAGKPPAAGGAAGCPGHALQPGRRPGTVGAQSRYPEAARGPRPQRTGTQAQAARSARLTAPPSGPAPYPPCIVYAVWHFPLQCRRPHMNRLLTTLILAGSASLAQADMATRTVDYHIDGEVFQGLLVYDDSVT